VPTQSADQAEIDFFMKSDAPPYRPAHGPHGSNPIPNVWYNLVTHAQRIDNHDATLGCTSKMHKQVLIRHNRSALVDTRQWNVAKYGQVCGFYRKSLQHPLKPGKAANINLIPPQLPGPNHEMWEMPTPSPIGHPQEPPPAPYGLYSNQIAGNQAKRAPSLRYYLPYKEIPAPSKAAIRSIQQVLDTMRKKKDAAELIKKFETRYDAWKKSWFEGKAGESQK
jgi:hypothetical protein